VRLGDSRLVVRAGSDSARGAGIFRRIFVVPINALIQHQPDEAKKAESLRSQTGFHLPE
jgi:hypothetical protein